ncbi:hypothetical protein PTKIN_Ptkin17bG0146200 [Pterospermum kingtungense]
MNLFKRLLPTKRGIIGAQKYCKDHSVEVRSTDQEVVIALGSNVGDRLKNFNEALQLMRKSGINITRHACLYETAPAYVTDQPRFLNSAVRAVTKLGPYELLGVLKKIEQDMGRTGSVIDSDTIACWHSFATDSDGLFGSWEKLGGESLVGKEGMKRVLPIRNNLWEWSEKTSVMGILNLTPDSFSDGGEFVSVEKAVSHVRLMISEGADIVDIGAQSTRQMASRISAEEELDRLIPVLEAVQGMPEMEEKLISVDTFCSDVASEAVKKGAHIINNVSAGQLDPNMHSIVAGLDVTYIAIHMRGDPNAIQSKLSGIPAWKIILDPGIGFSKNTEQYLDILMGLPAIREEIAKRSLAASHAPVLIGPSRKRFLGEICNRPAATERDPATIASIIAGILGGANIVRVHNVKDNVDAVKLCDAMLKERRIQS